MKIPREKKLFNVLSYFFLIWASSYVQAQSGELLTDHTPAAKPYTADLPNTRSTINPAQQLNEASLKPSTSDQLHAFIAAKREQLAAKGFRSELKIGNIDPRLSKRDCNKPIDFSFSKNPLERAHNTILMQCQQDKPWKLFVTLELKVFAPRLVASHSIARGATISARHLKQASVQVNRIKHGGFSDISLVQGMVAKRSIRAERLITADLLLPPLLVDRGDQVLIVAANDKIKIKMQGVAMSKGRKGQQIRIKNKQSQRIISAYVEDRGLVTVNL